MIGVFTCAGSLPFLLAHTQKEDGLIIDLAFSLFSHSEFSIFYFFHLCLQGCNHLKFSVYFNTNC